MALLSIPLSFRLSWVSVVIGATMSVRSSTPSSVKGFSVVKPAFFMPVSSKASSSTRIIAWRLHHLAFAFRAAGFIATSRSQKSPGVEIFSLPMCTWKPDTPETVPCGARISAG